MKDGYEHEHTYTTTCLSRYVAWPGGVPDVRVRSLAVAAARLQGEEAGVAGVAVDLAGGHVLDAGCDGTHVVAVEVNLVPHLALACSKAFI